MIQRKKTEMSCIMDKFVTNEDTFVMCSEPVPDLSAEMVTEAIERIETEQELADLFAVVDNKAKWVDDDVYDYEVGTAEYQQAIKVTNEWFALSDKLRDRIFAILRAEGVFIPETGQIDVLEPFMKKMNIEMVKADG